MAVIRYESALVEQALAKEYARQMELTLKKMSGLNDIKGLVRDFEKTFAAYIGVDNAVAVNSGSDGLKMALLACGVGEGDQVIVPDLTYQAVALAVLYCGAVPVPVDACQADLQMDPVAVEKAITPKTKAVIAAHMFGRPCDIQRIKTLCGKTKISLIEDVCQAESSCINKKMLGSFGDIAVFSFSYYKPLSSCGGGGGMVIAPKGAADRIRRWMEDWQDDKDLLMTGQRFAPLYFMDLIALMVKFTHLKEIIASRAKIKTFYEQELGAIKGLTIFKDKPGTSSVAQNFVVCTPHRDKLMAFLEKQGVSASKPYLPLHCMTMLAKKNKTAFPVSQWYYKQALHLPLYSFMSQDKAAIVTGLCRTFFQQNLNAGDPQ